MPVAARCAAFRLPPPPPPEHGDPLRDAGKMLSDFERQLTTVRDTFKRLQSRQNEDGLDLNELSQVPPVAARAAPASPRAVTAARPPARASQHQRWWLRRRRATCASTAL